MRIFRFCMILITLSITLSSCASITNSNTVVVTIHTNKESTVTVDGYEHSKSTKTAVSLQRKDSNQAITVKSDSLEKTIIICSEYSNYFLWGNMFCPVFCHAVDYVLSDNTRIYTYDDDIYIDMNNYIDDYSVSAFWEKRKKRRLSIVVPELNMFSQTVPELTKNINATGFLGLGLMYEQQYAENKYWSAALEIASDLPVPMPMIGQLNVDRDYGYQFCWHFDIRDNYDINEYLSIGYGLSVNRLLTPSKFGYEKGETKKDYESTAIGLSFAAKVRITKWFALGLNYNPSFFELLNDPEFDYSHYASLRLIFRTKVF